jgi:IS5 family transposase
VKTTLRIYFMQQLFKLSNPAMRDAPHDVTLFKEFEELNYGSRTLSERTILRFRHLLEKYELAEQILLAIVN